MTAVTRNGDQVHGELGEATDEGFVLWVDRGSAGGKISTRLSYDELHRAVLPEWNGWMALERVGSLKKDQNVELLLVNGTKVKGRLSSFSADGWVLEMGSEERQRFSLDDIASVRKQGMGDAAKVAIIASVAVGTLVILAIIALSSYDYGCCGGFL